MLGYASWPVVPTPMRLCVLGRSRHSDSLASHLATVYAGRDFELRVLDEASPRLDGCSALYVGAYDPQAWRALSPQLRDLPVLSICERSEGCATSGMFSLDIRADGATRFEVNLDAVARSRVRVRPQVLLLGKRGQAR